MDNSSVTERLENELLSLKRACIESIQTPQVRNSESFVRSLHFMVGKSCCVIEAADLKEIVDASLQVLTPIKNHIIVGAVAHRQEVYAVLDLASVLKVKSSNPKWILLLRSSTRRVGVLVDDIVGLSQLQLPLPALVPNAVYQDVQSEAKTCALINIDYLFRLTCPGEKKEKMLKEKI